MKTGPKFFSGSVDRALAGEIAQAYGSGLGDSQLVRFSDGELQPVLEETVRGFDVFLIQSTVPPADNLLELLLMVDAAKRASADNVVAVIPYFGMARQDRKDKPRVSIGSKLVANLLSAAGVTRVMTMDLHADQIQGFFDVPVDNVYGSPVLLEDIEAQKFEDLIVVSPDIGGVVRARAVAKQLGIDLAIIDKRRPRANVAEVMHIIGEIEGRTCLLVDDIIDTAGTLCSAAKALKAQGAKKVIAYCTHPVLSGKAIENLNNSELDQLVVTDSIPLSQAAKDCPRIRSLTLSRMRAEAVRRLSNEESLSAMFR